jgi:uncharacterized Tic20 family protein
MEQTAPVQPQLGEVVVESNPDARMWAMLAHLFGFAGFLFPFANIICPLIIWMVKREQFAFVDDQAKEALNFQISLTIYAILAGLSIFVLVGIVLLPVVLVFGIVCKILGCIRAHQGIAWRYPLTIRFIR